jgi:ER degradation enhancer, mannosidase alpha-like 2
MIHIGYPLRPELIESLMFLYRATGDKSLFAIGEDILRSIQHSTRTPCGYATVKDVRDHRLEDRMESFFLAETTKYLYLLFDPDNFIHGRGNSGKVHQVASRTCILDSGAYIFNTEAHPIDAGALDCCHGPTDDEIWQSVWFPQNVVDTTTDRSREDLENDTVQQEGPTILKSRSVNWVDVFLVGTNTKMCASFEIPKNTASIKKGSRVKEVIKRKKKKGSKEAFQYSMLTCSAAHFNEKLCIGGEICDF